MSYAIQCLQEHIIGVGGYVNEVKLFNEFHMNESILFTAFGELIKRKFLSKEFFESKCHKVLGKFSNNSNTFEVNPNVTNDQYDELYSIEINQSYIFEDGKKYTFYGLKQLFVGTRKAAQEQAQELTKMLKADENFPFAYYRIRKIC